MNTSPMQMSEARRYSQLRAHLEGLPSRPVSAGLDTASRTARPRRRRSGCAASRRDQTVVRCDVHRSGRVWSEHALRVVRRHERGPGGCLSAGSRDPLARPVRQGPCGRRPCGAHRGVRRDGEWRVGAGGRGMAGDRAAAVEAADGVVQRQRLLHHRRAAELVRELRAPPPLGPAMGSTPSTSP